jgi:hypothetical protein
MLMLPCTCNLVTNCSSSKCIYVFYLNRFDRNASIGCHHLLFIILLHIALVRKINCCVIYLKLFSSYVVILCEAYL